MKKLAFLVLALVIVLSGVMIIGCGGGGGSALDDLQNQAQGGGDKGTPSSSGSQSSSDDDDSEGFGDIPVYPGADQIAKTQTKDNSLSEPRTIEQRIYSTDDSAEDVSDFYRDRMPDKGWEEMSWTEMPEGFMGSYEKGVYSSATITITPNVNGRTAIMIMTAYPD